MSGWAPALPDCPDYLQGSSEVCPRACAHWGGSVWCQLPGRTCRHRACWQMELTEMERGLMRFLGPPEDCDD